MSSGPTRFDAISMLSVTRLRTTACLVVLAATSAFAEGAPSPHDALLQALSAETESVRDDALARLVKTDDLADAEVRAALKTADRRAKALLFRVAAAHGMKTLVPELTEGLTSQDPLVSDAAVRALVSLGDEAVAAGVTALAAAKDAAAAAVRVHLAALAAQRVVEREVLARWRRKGGSYEGRYAELAKLGWPVQPVLLAMLLDIPLTDGDVVLPAGMTVAQTEVTKALTLQRLASSHRRGYKTFDPLPASVEPEELFELAAQALKDVAELDLMGDILEFTAETLKQHDELKLNRLRRTEHYLAQRIDIILAARGRPERLIRTADEIKRDVERYELFARRGAGGGVEMSDILGALNRELCDYGEVLHQLRRYDEAARCFKEALDIDRKVGGRNGKLSANTGYNRACALACAKRKDDAFAQLDVALDRDKSTGGEDLSREWVTEDGDLANLRDDPRWADLIHRRFDVQ